MSRRIDDDVVPPLPTEERPRRIDGDALLLFFKKCIEQERVFELLPCCQQMAWTFSSLPSGNDPVSA